MPSSDMRQADFSTASPPVVEMVDVAQAGRRVAWPGSPAAASCARTAAARAGPRRRRTAGRRRRTPGRRSSVGRARPAGRRSRARRRRPGRRSRRRRCRPAALRRRGDGRELRRPVQPLAGAQRRPSALDAQLHAVAVELDLVHPAGPAGGRSTELAELRLDEVGHRRGLAGFAGRLSARRLPRLAGGARRAAAGLAFPDRVGRDAARQS